MRTGYKNKERTISGCFNKQRVDRTKLTMVWQSVSKVSNKELSAETASSGPPSPLSRRRLKRMYQLVSSSTRLSRRGTTVYKR